MAAPKYPQGIKHPNYTLNEENWLKWRLAYEGGDRFLRRYLQKFTKRESNAEYAERLLMSYVPAFAKAAIKEVKNSIYQRMSDVTRLGGSDSYQEAVAGANGGVDYLHNSMNTFIGDEVLSDLLVMRRVGVYVDMPPLTGNTKADVRGARPYLYWYRTEDIYNWDEDPDRPGEYTNLFLGDTTCQQDSDTFLPTATAIRYRHIYIGEDGFVWVQYYNQTDRVDADPIKLNIRRIPFVVLDIQESLMMDIANYQIALTNMASSDVTYSTKAGFPMYVEQFDPKTESPYIKNQTPNAYFNQSSGYDPASNTVAVANQENRNAIVVGVNTGRKYPIGTNTPAFISPSSEPLKASMEKQAQMKAEIRELVQLAVSNLSDGTADVPADSNAFEAGLAIIGLKLQTAERKIAEFWAMYEGIDGIAEVSYPSNYQVISDTERLDSANKYIEVIPKIPSKTFQKEMAKKVIRILLQNKVPIEILRKMEAEIDSANVISIDPEVIAKDFESGFVGLDTASQARGYPKGEVAKAAQDHADRIERIAISQAKGGGTGALADTAQARGVGELGANGKAGVEEKQSSLDTTQDDVVRRKQRGDGT